MLKADRQVLWAVVIAAAVLASELAVPIVSQLFSARCASTAVPCSGDALTAAYTRQVATYTGLLFLATVVLAGFGAYQGWLTKRGLDVARADFVAVHRPKIIVRGFEIQNTNVPVGEPIEGWFMVQNIGDTPAHIWEINTRTVICEPKRLRGDIALADRQEYDITLTAGEAEQFLFDAQTAPDHAQSFRLLENNEFVYVVGQVRYRDNNKIERQTGFIRKWDIRTNTWSTVTESDYEYAF
jgi:hypothetical protein